MGQLKDGGRCIKHAKLQCSFSLYSIIHKNIEKVKKKLGLTAGVIVTLLRGR